jgi:hypothetical protein
MSRDEIYRRALRELRNLSIQRDTHIRDYQVASLEEMKNTLFDSSVSDAYKLSLEMFDQQIAAAEKRVEQYTPNSEMVELFGEELHDAIRNQYEAITWKTPAWPENRLVNSVGLFYYVVPKENTLVVTKDGGMYPIPPYVDSFQQATAEVREWGGSRGRWLIAYADKMNVLFYQRLAR